MNINHRTIQKEEGVLETESEMIHCSNCQCPVRTTQL